MTLTELRYIVALDQTQHFGKAAEQCYVSQPTLSVAIKKLEEELDVELFERSRNQVRATPLGEQIIKQAQTVLEQTHIITELANAGKDPLGSILSIGAIFTIGPYLFPQVVPHLQNTAPAMPLYIEENYTAVLRERLHSGQLDAIVVALPFNEPDVVTQTLFEEPFVVLMTKDNPLAKHQSISPSQLEQEPVLLLGEGHCFRDQVLSACPNLLTRATSNRAPEQPIIEGSSLETLKYMVSSGLGITVLPASAAQLDQSNDLLTTRPISSPASNRTVALAWRASFPRHKAIDALSQTILQCHEQASTEE